MLRAVAVASLAAAGLAASRVIGAQQPASRRPRNRAQGPTVVLRAEAAAQTEPLAEPLAEAPAPRSEVMWSAHTGGAAAALCAAALALPDAWVPLITVLLVLIILAATAALLRWQRQAARPASVQQTAQAAGQQQQQHLAAEELWEGLAQRLGGVWVKDKAASDSMEPACALMQLNGLIRTAIRLIRGLEIRIGRGQFEMAVLSGILWFRVTERYPLTGEPRQWGRRDLRRGRATGWVELGPEPGSVALHLAWEDPVGGTGADVFKSPQPGVLWVDCTLTVGGRTEQYRQVYRRQQQQRR